MEELKNRIINLINVTHSTIEDIDAEEDFIEACGIDSLAFIRLISALEKEFNIIVIDDQFSINKINTLNKLSEYIKDKLS